MSELDDVAAALGAVLPGAVERDVPGADLTTYRIGGPLAVLARLGSLADVRAAATVLASADVPVIVIGRGSNVLVADQGFRGVAMTLTGDFEAVVPDAATATVRAGGAAPLPVVARRSAAAGITGLEFYVGIPGSVGGAVRMNAGGHGRDTRAVLVEADVFDLGRAEVTTRPARDLALGYRVSALGDLDLVVEARFRGGRDARDRCEERLADVVRWRRENQPGGANAGSVFANPPGDSAGRLVDACGLKGLRIGGAVVSAKHANFIQADPGATAADVHRLVCEVRRRVAEETGVDLRPELRLVGFDGAHDDAPTRRPSR